MIRDRLKEQLEQIGKNIKRIVTKFTELPLDREHWEELEKSKQELKETIDVDIDIILRLSPDEMVIYFSERKLTDKHLEHLVDYLHHVALLSHFHQGKDMYYFTLLQKEIELLHTADVISQSFSVNRMHRRTEIENIIIFN